jgi:hypothetical protein
VELGDELHVRCWSLSLVRWRCVLNYSEHMPMCVKPLDGDGVLHSLRVSAVMCASLLMAPLTR